MKYSLRPPSASQASIRRISVARRNQRAMSVSPVAFLTSASVEPLRQERGGNLRVLGVAGRSERGPLQLDGHAPDFMGDGRHVLEPGADEIVQRGQRRHLGQQHGEQERHHHGGDCWSALGTSSPSWGTSAQIFSSTEGEKSRVP